MTWNCLSSQQKTICPTNLIVDSRAIFWYTISIITIGEYPWKPLVLFAMSRSTLVDWSWDTGRVLSAAAKPQQKRSLAKRSALLLPTTRVLISMWGQSKPPKAWADESLSSKRRYAGCLMSSESPEAYWLSYKYGERSLGPSKICICLLAVWTPVGL